MDFNQPATGVVDPAPPENSSDPEASSLASVIEALARADATSFDAHLVTIGDPHTLDQTRANIRCHFIRMDPNGRPRTRALAERLASSIIDYCIPRSRINEAREEQDRTGSTHKFGQLAREATQLFTLQDNSGEGGELLLYALLETMLGIPQILCKMSLKTNRQMHVHGTDGVHAKLLPDGTLALYWGESKLMANVNTAIDACLKSIAPYLTDDSGSTTKRDLLLIRDHLDAGAAEATQALIRFFSEDDPQSANLEIRAACLVGFSLAEYPDFRESHERDVRQDIRGEIETWQTRAERVIDRHGLQAFELEIFFVPMPSVEDFRKELRSALGIVP